MSTVNLTLTSYNMGDVTEADYDAWISYVCDHIDDETGLDVGVEASQFGRGSDEDHVVGSDDEKLVVREALIRLWDSFCASDFGRHE